MHKSLWTQLSHSAWTGPTSCFLFPRIPCVCLLVILVAGLVKVRSGKVCALWNCVWVRVCVCVCVRASVSVNHVFSLRVTRHRWGLWGFPELCPKPPMNMRTHTRTHTHAYTHARTHTHAHTHSCKEKKTQLHTCRHGGTESVLSLQSVLVLECVRGTEGGTVLPWVFLGIKRGFCLPFGLVTCEPEPGDVKQFVELKMMYAVWSRVKKDVYSTEVSLSIGFGFIGTGASQIARIWPGGHFRLWCSRMSVLRI